MNLGKEIVNHIHRHAQANPKQMDWTDIDEKIETASREDLEKALRFLSGHICGIVSYVHTHQLNNLRTFKELVS